MTTRTASLAASAFAALLSVAAPADEAPRAKAPTPESRFMAACGHDVESFCKGVEPGQGRIVACLRAHKDELSEGCRAFRQGARVRLARPNQSKE